MAMIAIDYQPPQLSAILIDFQLTQHLHWFSAPSGGTIATHSQLSLPSAIVIDCQLPQPKPLNENQYHLSQP